MRVAIELTFANRILSSNVRSRGADRSCEFLGTLPYGWFFEEIGPRGLVVFLTLWLAGYFGLPLIPFAALVFPSWVAILDIALVFIIFKGDVRLS